MPSLKVLPFDKSIYNVVSEVALLPCHNHPSSYNRATALAMLDVVTPTCRAISAIDNPNSSRPRFAIIALRVLTFLRRLPPLISLGAYSSFLALFFDDLGYG